MSSTPPPPGVSTIGPAGTRSAVRVEASEKPTKPAVKRTARRIAPGEDVLRDPSKFRVVDPSSPPPGTGRQPTDVREMDLPGVARGRNTKFKSVDGKTYTFQTHDAKGNPLERRISLCTFLAIREMQLGGDPFAIFDAFKLKILDINGLQVYPNLSEEMEEPEDKGFSLGE